MRPRGRPEGATRPRERAFGGGSKEDSPVPAHQPGSSLNAAGADLKAERKMHGRGTEDTDQSWVRGRNSTFYLRFTESEHVSLGDSSHINRVCFEEINTGYTFGIEIYC